MHDQDTKRWIRFLTPEEARALLAAAVRCYVRDIRTELSTGRNPDRSSGYPSALTDWNGGRYQLTRLANHGGLEPDELAEEIEQSLTAFWNKHGKWAAREGRRAA